MVGRDNAAGYQQIPAANVATEVARIKAAFEALEDPNDWTGDGQPEGWDVIDRIFTKAEARYIPNGDDSTADMSHPTRTGDLVVFANPPYQYDAATPGTLFARSAFFGQHGYVPDVQDLDTNTNMRATFLAGGKAIDRGVVHDVRSIDLAPTAAFLLDVPVPERSQGVVRRDLLEDGNRYRPISIVGLNDFHGQLDPSTQAGDNGIANSVGGAGQLATLFDEEADALPGRTLLLAAGDNVGASPPSSALLQDIPTIDVENAWGLDATSFGNHEFDFGIERILLHQDRANFPFLATNVVETATGREPDWMDTSKVFWVNGMRVGVIGSVVRNTPELVKPGNTAGLAFLDEAERIERESARLRRWGVKIQVVVIHEGAVAGANRVDGNASAPWSGPIIGITEKLQNTTVDLVIAGHTHRAANTVVGRIPIVEGFNAGISYSVAQLMVRGDDVAWTGAATRTAKNLGVTPRADVKAIVDKANADTAPLRNVVIGSSSVDILRDNPARLRESDMGNVVADAMRAKYAEDGVQAAITNSGGLREDFIRTRTGGGEAVGEITWGEAFAVLPFGNSTVIETLTYEQLVAALANGFRPPCGDSSGGTGRTPQYSGLWVEFHCNGTVPAIDNVWLAPPGPRPTTAPLGPGSTVRLVTNDFMFGGGDGYTALSGGTNVLQTGDLLLDVLIDHIKANSPISPPPRGRRAGPFELGPVGAGEAVIRTSLVGSYAQPNWLIDRERLRDRFPPRVRARELWRIDPAYLEEAHDDATRLAIADQERAGLDILTDGEMRRESYSNRFATALDGVDIDNPGTALDRSGHPNPVPRVVGPVSRRHPVQVRDLEFLRAHTSRPVKMTVPGPFTMSQQAQDDHYGDPAALGMAYADAVREEIADLFAAGADVVQVDEPYMQARPEPAREYGLAALKRATDGFEGTTAVHICFGYAAIIHERPSGYSFLPELAATECDQISIETGQSGLDLEVLDSLPR